VCEELIFSSSLRILTIFGCFKILSLNVREHGKKSQLSSTTTTATAALNGPWTDWNSRPRLFSVSTLLLGVSRAIRPSDIFTRHAHYPFRVSLKQGGEENAGKTENSVFLLFMHRRKTKKVFRQIKSLRRNERKKNRKCGKTKNFPRRKITHLDVVSKKFDSRFISSLRNLFISGRRKKISGLARASWATAAAVLTIFHATHLVVEALANRREFAVDDAEVAVELDGNISVCTVSHCDAF
jgi:hypothetical protein